jgi:hypothetical protein
MLFNWHWLTRAEILVSKCSSFTSLSRTLIPHETLFCTSVTDGGSCAWPYSPVLPAAGPPYGDLIFDELAKLADI